MVDPLTAVIAKSGIDLVLQLLKPITDKLQKGISSGSEILYDQIFNSYRDYLRNAFEHHSYFRSVVFNNQRKKLEDYYLPLTIIHHPNEEETKIKDFPHSLFQTFEKILIVDNAGMGKTTLLKYLFLRCVHEGAGIPIYIELRKLSKDKSLLAFIHERLADLADSEETTKSHLVYNLLDSGKFVLFFDGYDEIPEAQREVVTEGLQTFLEKAPRNRYLMTSRDETSLNAFAQFQRFKIRPLQKEEAYTLLKNYAGDQVADTLIARLEQPENVAVLEFISNPLLTSLLYKSFNHKPTIPLRKHLFYRQVYDALYEAHDLSKEGGEYQRIKKSGLDIDQFEQVLRRLGILTYQNNKIEFTKGELLEYIQKAKELSADIKSASSSILDDLTHAVPLMVKDGHYIRWAHKSIQEYFAAQYICGNMGGKQQDILLFYLRSDGFPKHINLITLCADIDATSFKHSIAKELAETLLGKYDSIYSDLSDIPSDVLEHRKCLTTGRIFMLTRMDLPDDFSLELKPSLAEYNGIFLPTHLDVMKRLADEGIAMEYGSTISWAKVGICEVFTKESRYIEVLHRGTELPFIEPLPKDKAFNAADLKAFLTRMNKTLHDTPKAQMIDYKPTNPLNQPEMFADINMVLEINPGWKFNPENARKLLKEIEDECNAHKDFMKVLSHSI